MEVIFRKSAGGEVTPDQHARASAAVDRVLEGSRHSVWDALTAMDYLTAWDDCPPEQRVELGNGAADLDEAGAVQPPAGCVQQRCGGASMDFTPSLGRLVNESCDAAVRVCVRIAAAWCVGQL